MNRSENTQTSGPGSEGPSRKGRARGAITNAGWNSFLTVWGIAVSFVIAPLLIRKFGEAQYGLLLLVWSFTGILGLVGFGFGEATLRYIAHYFGEGNLASVNRIIGATLTFYLVICVIVSMGLFAAAPWVVELFHIPESDRYTLSWLLRIAAVIYSLRALAVTYGTIPMALQRYDISSKIGVAETVVRFLGYIVLALFSGSIVFLVLWDVCTQALVLGTQVVVVQRLCPGIQMLPSFSLKGLREIVGFSIFSFLTYGFLMMQRESGKMILAAKLGTAPVAYLGTPDNVALRIHMVVASGSETLMPRFSANRNVATARALFRNGTWSALVVSLLFLVPLVVLMPDFLSLWISPEFSRESAAVGQLVALGYITQGAYTPAATFFRGSGKPSRVTLVIFFAGLLTMLSCFVLIPRYGVIGVGYAYLLGCIPTLFGLLHGWFHMFGRSSLQGLLRIVGTPVLMAGLAAGMQYWIRGSFGELNWFGLFALGGLFFAIISALIFGADWAFGGTDAPSKQFLRKIGESEKLMFLLRFLPVRRAS